MQRIVLAYSGDLATTVAIPWLREHAGGEVIAMTLDLGQGRELDDVRERALAAGAVRAHVIDAREEFASDFILRALQAGAVGLGGEPLAGPLAQPLIAKRLAEVARIEGAPAVAHGGVADAIDAAVRSVQPSLTVMTPARQWVYTRAELVDYARARRIPVPSPRDEAQLSRANLWGRAVLPEAASPAPPATTAIVTLEFERGVPVTINGIGMPFVDLVSSLETIAGAYGVGRLDLRTTPASGRLPVSTIDAPAAVVLQAAHRDLQRRVTSPELGRLAADLAGAYADLVRAGRWFTLRREAIDAFVAVVQSKVTGTVRLELGQGQCRVIDATS